MKDSIKKNNSESFTALLEQHEAGTAEKDQTED